SPYRTRPGAPNGSRSRKRSWPAFRVGAFNRSRSASARSRSSASRSHEWARLWNFAIKGSDGADRAFLWHSWRVLDTLWGRQTCGMNKDHRAEFRLRRRPPEDLAEFLCKSKVRHGTKLHGWRVSRITGTTGRT